MLNILIFFSIEHTYCCTEKMQLSPHQSPRPGKAIHLQKLLFLLWLPELALQYILTWNVGNIFASHITLDLP